MRYEKMRGKSVSECVTRIRKEFGESAIIIEHREVQEGGVLGSGLFSRKTYEVDFMIPERESHEIPKRKTLPQEAFQERKLDAVFEEKQNGTVRPNKRERQEKLERENRLTDLQSTLRKLKEERAQELIALHSEKRHRWKSWIPGIERKRLCRFFLPDPKRNRNPFHGNFTGEPIQEERSMNRKRMKRSMPSPPFLRT